MPVAMVLLLVLHLSNKLSLSFINGEHHNSAGNAHHSRVVEGLTTKGR
jgi:hypothetical protein